MNKEIKIKVEKINEHIAVLEDKEAIRELVAGEGRYIAVISAGDIELCAEMEKVRLMPFVVSLRPRETKKITDYLMVEDEFDVCYEVVKATRAKAIDAVASGAYYAYRVDVEGEPLLLYGWGYYPPEMYLVAPYMLKEVV